MNPRCLVRLLLIAHVQMIGNVAKHGVIVRPDYESLLDLHFIFLNVWILLVGNRLDFLRFHIVLAVNEPEISIFDFGHNSVVGIFLWL